ncbi:hypothetical protein TGVAND_357750 [Toxoplasma gondii VAND]|uniref:Uncharacterized protein n=2 Tax=Toxoplasma gondii TaxID=5811 RepID=A0A425I038_TOXGO|nr:hypothetical protein TGVAND_357750 [Toxoplasma gondii VAND]RQX71910.1 hypothetical protein TGCAST_357750 [Toxoplasma gondii CAST]
MRTPVDCSQGGFACRRSALPSPGPKRPARRACRSRTVCCCTCARSDIRVSSETIERRTAEVASARKEDGCSPAEKVNAQAWTQASLGDSVDSDLLNVTRSVEQVSRATPHE